MLNLYGRWVFKINRDSNLISIDFKEKTIAEWREWFATKQQYDLSPDSKMYKLLENGLEAAIVMKKSLEIMNEGNI